MCQQSCQLTGASEETETAIEKHCDFLAGVTIIAAKGPGPSLLV